MQASFVSLKFCGLQYVLRCEIRHYEPINSKLQSAGGITALLFNGQQQANDGIGYWTARKVLAL
jgi:hypothetical protein